MAEAWERMLAHQREKQERELERVQGAGVEKEKP